MDLLLDTHVFVWWDSNSARLGGPARAAIADPANRIFVSAASIWEIAIKRRIGKLAFDGSAARAVGGNGFVEVPISGVEAEAAGALDWTHSDPFDRLILAQAKARAMTLVTVDPAMRAHGGVALLEAG
ncbi:MAG TPA: type II toxin-antitoxin system VapC family toxin [Caulobacteraceae bacterium]|nr:type II toxin-antitoxin system VapC family toxin [Caulobacteraceae bacterium]